MFRDDLPLRAVCRDTVVANAAVNFGVQPTVAAAAIGDLRVQVASLFSQLVPSAQAEVPLLDVNAAGSVQPMIDAGSSVVSSQTSVRLGPSFALHIGSGLVPGSLRIVVSGAELTDDGGQLKSAGTVVGTVDYGRGIVAFAPETHF
jgi:hypothetical protein